MSTDKTSDAPPESHSQRPWQSRRIRLAVCITIFLIAFGVRLLSWHDTRLEVGKVQTTVSGDYKRVAQLLRQGGVASFLSSSSPLSDLNTLGHPPGYSILVAIVYSVCGDSDTAVQFVQIVCDALAAVMIFLIVGELLPLSAAIVAGMLAALSPQFAWNSVLLLPDSLFVLPILLAVYCLARAAKNPRLVTFIVAGALVGISCWLRANTMLLTFFLAAAVLLLFRSERSWRFALAVVCGTLLIVLPLTIRNAIVFHRFIPLSLGAGQTLLEGIADYDHEGRFNIPKTDMGIMKQEAEDFHRPDYYTTLFNPDGVERERARLARGFAVIRSHPFWFAGVMTQRAAAMVRLERSRLVSTEPPVSHTLNLASNPQLFWGNTPAELLSGGVVPSPRTRTSVSPDGQSLRLEGDDSQYDDQFMSAPVNVEKNADYVFTVPIKIEQGRIKLSVRDAKGKTYSSAIAEMLETKSAVEQPLNMIQLSFVASKDDRVRLVFSNEASIPSNPVVHVGPTKLFELGPARFLWTRYPRFLVHGIQKIFLTAVMLPLAIIGLVLLAIKRQWLTLTILLVVPVYFFCVQSIVHTEYRYVLAVDYFLFALVSVVASSVIGLVRTRYFVPGARTSRPH
ncbi:MAG TPA: glycosyltransferase family 39 protein [Pyrinomonadaceae bacterium]|nr:glycosyltransferase family 39 protein [Pyrinomonadaceae bacterium]